MSDLGQTPASMPSILDPAKLASNLAQVLEQYAKLARLYAEKPEAYNSEANTQIFPLAQVAQTLGSVAQAHLNHPDRLMEAQARLWSQYSQVWSNAWSRAIGQQPEPIVTAAPSDRRFKDKEWVDNSFFDALKQFYLLTTSWTMEMIQSAEGIDPHTRQKAKFYAENLLNAFAPSNFPATNPEVLRTTLASNGENLLRGLQKLHNDMLTPDGRLRISQVDSSAFVLGETIATTPGKVVFRNALFELIQYSPQMARTHEIPLLIVPPWINKYYILDLNQKKSFIKYCVENGLTVFIMSWANADDSLGHKQFEDYMREGVLTAIDAVQCATSAGQVNTAGFCIGGTLLASTLGYLSANNDHRVASSTFFTTQVDFEKAGDLLVYVDEAQVKWIEDRMGDQGYLPGSRMADAFNLLRSNDLIWSFVVNNYLLGKDPMAFDLLYWNSDSTRMPRGVHSYYLRQCYLNNALSSGKMVLDNTRIDLKQVKTPIYNLACKDDHIAPMPSVFRMAEFMGGPVTFVVSGSGHIAGVINPPQAKKYKYWTNEAKTHSLENWLAKADEHEGSWWPHWLQWITGQSGEKVVAPVPGESDLPIIEDAPGTYARVSGLY
jgi:polyhydroxyalkanoate synthase subunit PhaC